MDHSLSLKNIPVPLAEDLFSEIQFIFAGDVQDKWLPYQIKVNHNKVNIHWQSENLMLSFSSEKNELEELVSCINDFVGSDSLSFFFEPVEPCFQLELKKNKYDDKLQLHFWVDNGNYLAPSQATWDAIGFRFYISQDEVRKFAKEGQEILTKLSI